MFNEGDVCLTRGGWKAVVVNAETMTVYHHRYFTEPLDGIATKTSHLFTHNRSGLVTSRTVGRDYDLAYRLVAL